MTEQIYSSIPTAQLIIEYCKRYGVLDVVISPGSRNAPLTIGFSNDKTIQTYSVVDERCAAFFALGIAQKKVNQLLLYVPQAQQLPIIIQLLPKPITVIFRLL